MKNILRVSGYFSFEHTTHLKEIHLKIVFVSTNDIVIIIIQKLNRVHALLIC